MIRVLAFLVGLASASSLCAQSTILEGMLGNENYFYQHTLSGSIGSSRFGFFHTSSLHAFYESDGLNELMSQSFITYPVTGFAKLAIGTFYTSKPGISPAAAVQLGYANHDFSATVVPRIDIQKNGSVEIMMLFEYHPDINDRVQLYSRAQFMTNYGPYHHNRSYQNFRAGLQVKQTVVGMALNIDERGSDLTTLYNWGVFLRYEFH
jgi:hypothetical protein